MSSGAAAAGPAYAYLGTSAFAATVLGKLVAEGSGPALVITPPDRRRGRGRALAPPPAAALARELGLDLHQTDDVNSASSRQAIGALDTALDLAAVCAFGQLISEPLLSALPMLNVHPSLLPRWRGAAPIERAIMAGDELTGVCVIKLTAGLDSGPVGLREEVAIRPSDDYGSLSERLADVGAQLLGDALRRFATGRLELVEQDAAGITYAEKIDPVERVVRATDSPAATVSSRIRALTPHIGAYVVLAGGDRLAVRDAAVVEGGPEPGAFADGGERLILGCETGALGIGSVQPEGKRWMPAADYVRGYGLPARLRTAG